MFDLNAKDASALLKVLDHYIPELRHEIHRTEFSRELRQRLAAEESVLTDLRQRLAAASKPLES